MVDELTEGFGACALVIIIKILRVGEEIVRRTFELLQRGGDGKCCIAAITACIAAHGLIMWVIERSIESVIVLPRDSLSSKLAEVCAVATRDLFFMEQRVRERDEKKGNDNISLARTRIADTHAV